MIKLVLQIVGWLLAHTPEFLLRLKARVLGDLALLLLPRRRRLFASNLEHAFPDRPKQWRQRIARESSRRVVETLLLSLASPFLSDRRLRAIGAVSPEVERLLTEHRAHPHPIMFATVHMAYWEAQAWLGLIAKSPIPEIGVIFRPLDNPSADAWVKKTRERFGLKLLSRKEGFQQALKILRNNGAVALLFDQNAGMQGALTTLFGRVCSTTELTGLLTEKLGASLWTFYPRRLGFWRLELCAAPVQHDGTVAGITVAVNRWLEETLSSNDELCASWLWSHDRWRHQDMPRQRLRLHSKRDLLTTEKTQRGWTELPRRTRVWIRMPNWLGDVVMALPLLRAVRASRPDAEITLLAKPSFAPLLESWGVADRVEPLPAKGAGYFTRFWKLRELHPDVFLLLTNSVRGDLEAWLTRCPQRFGIARRGRRRPLLTHRYEVPAGFCERDHHQLELWENFFRHFGLNGPLDLTPVRSPAARVPGSAPVFGFIAGSENTPEKRWPVTHWRTLCTQLLSEYSDASVVLFGTANDRPITAAIAAGGGERVQDLAGRTGLAEYVEKLRQCDVLVTNDTGGMHLANALGVPPVALFGPTNPIRTGPVFSAPHDILQPAGCPPTGGASLAELAPDVVLSAIRRRLAAAPVN